jgi:hypothetical protein
MESNLKVYEIIISALTPIAITVAGFFINNAIKTREHELALIRSKQDIRKEVYEEIGPKLNKIYCFICNVGDFGYYEPTYFIDIKREVDSKFYTYKKLWRNKTIMTYMQFMDLCYDTYSGDFGVPAKFRTTINEKEAFYLRVGKKWRQEWNINFTNHVDSDAVSKNYEIMVESFIEDIISSKSL